MMPCRLVVQEYFDTKKEGADFFTLFLTIKANEMHYFSKLFDKVLYMFRTGRLFHHQEYLNTV